MFSYVCNKGNGEIQDWWGIPERTTTFKSGYPTGQEGGEIEGQPDARNAGSMTCKGRMWRRA
jgi:hypothetical protein